MDAIEGWLVNTTEEFFAPVPFDLFNNLMSDYGATRQRLEAMAAAVSAESCSGVLHYFIKANKGDEHLTVPKTVSVLFELKPAIAVLDAEFWDRALKLTDVLDYMPQKRKNEWYEQINNPMGRAAKRLSAWEIEAGKVQNEWEIEPIPEFTADTARSTLENLIAMRPQFFGERVDGIFQSLSRTHVTNSPKAFRQRMILPRALSSYGTIEWETAGVINDLRCVIAKFMGRDEPCHGATEGVIKVAKGRTGKWVAVDGGALRIRVYAGVGTAHIEVHPEMAGRLNAILANLYPMAIPHDFVERKKPKKSKDHQVFSRPIPFTVLSLLSTMRSGYRKPTVDAWRGGYESIPCTRMFGQGEHDKAAKNQAEAILQTIGGVLVKDGNLKYWKFEYDPEEVLEDIACSGQIPDHQSHQFYPTPENVARHAVALASAGSAPGMSWLEPSAGIGNIADLMPRGSTQCIEISELHASILRAKKHTVTVADFLQAPTDQKFDRIVMNPPFSQGRWQAHLEHASRLLAAGGRVVAVLPASARGKALLPGFNAVWSDVLANEFAGTTVSVVIGSFERSA